MSIKYIALLDVRIVILCKHISCSTTAPRSSCTDTHETTITISPAARDVLLCKLLAVLDFEF